MPIQPDTTDQSTPTRRPRFGFGMRLALAVPALALVGLLVAASAPLRSVASAGASVSQLELRPNDRQRKVARLVGEMFERSHYSQLVADEKLSSQVYDHYLQSLDSSRSYFLKSDIDEFERYRPQLAEAVRTGSRLRAGDLTSACTVALCRVAASSLFLSSTARASPSEALACPRAGLKNI